MKKATIPSASPLQPKYPKYKSLRTSNIYATPQSVSCLFVCACACLLPKDWFQLSMNSPSSRVPLHWLTPKLWRSPKKSPMDLAPLQRALQSSYPHVSTVPNRSFRTSTASCPGSVHATSPIDLARSWCLEASSAKEAEEHHRNPPVWYAPSSEPCS